MIKELIFASNNQHKVEEFRNIVGERFRVVTLKEAGIHIDIPEPFNSLEANASQKSRVINELTGKPCFSEDTGLEVVALGGEPGVKSARYAGEEQDSAKNIEKLLKNMKGQDDRTARFRTVISLRLNNEEHLFEGICDGSIGLLPKGSNGFGYDPVFTPAGWERTFAEMTLEEKARFSHRKRASDKLVLFLQHCDN
jgi:XTP/dITP diphosphohydrolase